MVVCWCDVVLCCSVVVIVIAVVGFGFVCFVGFCFRVGFWGGLLGVLCGFFFWGGFNIGSDFIFDLLRFSQSFIYLFIFVGLLVVFGRFKNKKKGSATQCLGSFTFAFFHLCILPFLLIQRTNR